MEENTKDKLSLVYCLSTLTAATIASGLAGKQPPKISDVFPNVFPAEKPDKKTIIAQFAAYANTWNTQRHKGDKDK